MIKFSEFITEDILRYLDKDELETAREMLDAIKTLNLFKVKCKYRGFNGPGNANGISEVTNKRSGFYGSVSPVTKILIKEFLKIKNPTFVAMNYSKAAFFGKVHLYIPYKKSAHYQSWTIQDVVTDLPNEIPKDKDEDRYFEDLQSSYGGGTGIENCKSPGSEIIADTEKYYLVNYDTLVSNIKSKFFKPVTDWKKEITYGDLYEAINAYIKYSEFLIKIGKKKSFNDTTKDFENTQNRNKKSAEEKLSKKNREMRKKIIEKDAEKEGWNINIKEVPYKHNKIKTDGKAYLITTKYIKTKKEILKFYEKKVKGGRETKAEDISPHLFGVGNKKNEITLI